MVYLQVSSKPDQVKRQRHLRSQNRASKVIAATIVSCDRRAIVRNIHSPLHESAGNHLLQPRCLMMPNYLIFPIKHITVIKRIIRAVSVFLYKSEVDYATD